MLELSKLILEKGVLILAKFLKPKKIKDFKTARNEIRIQ